jgi:aquaporin Z
MFGRRNIATLVAEFLGTGVLTLLILSVQRSTIGVPFFVALAAGFAYIVMTFALGTVSGANFNPALTLGLWTARQIKTLTAVLFIVAQFLGAYAAYALYTYFVKSKLQDVGGHFTGRILVAEAVGTGIFAFGWAAGLYRRFSAGSMAAVAGLAYTVGIVAASPAAIGVLNPAVALGIKSFVWGTYVLGPVLGAIIGVNLYSLLFSEAALAGAGNAAAVATTAPAASSAAAVKEPAAKRRTTSRDAATAKRPTAAKRRTTSRKK